MKKFILCLSLVAVLGLSGISEGALGITYIELAAATGGQADYDASAGTLVWSGGASGFLILENGTTLDFQQPGGNVAIEGSFSNVSAVGTDSISFGTGSFKLTFSPWNSGMIVIEGKVPAGQTYNELIGGDFPPIGVILGGLAFVDVEAYFFDEGRIIDGVAYWKQNSYSKLTSAVIAPTGFDDYMGKNYASDNVTIIIESDYIPEPATLGLLGFGAIALLRRKK